MNGDSGGSSLTTPYLEPLGTYLTNNPTLSADLGAWGVDTNNHTVWAIVNHTGDFAVVPEPSTLLLLGVGAIGLLDGVRRHRSKRSIRNPNP